MYVKINTVYRPATFAGCGKTVAARYRSRAFTFYDPLGPPGTGKTTLAEVIARYANADVERISAVTSGVKEIREAIERARQNRNAGRRTILLLMKFTVSTKASRMHFCHILKTAPSLLLAQPLKTRRLSLIRHCFPVPVSIC